MKRHYPIIMSVAVAVAGPALAQSNVTTYGVLDVAVLVSHGSQTNTTQVVSGNLFPSRIGFRGIEDLGKGLSASFTLEAGINLDTGEGVSTNSNNQASGWSPGGAFTFNRQAWVGLKGGFGEVHLGRDYTPTYWTTVKYDVAYTGGTAASETSLRSVSYSNPGGARSSNALVYIMPKTGGFTLTSMYALGENPSTAGAHERDGRYAGARLTYAEGPVDVSLAHARYSLSAVGDLKESIIGGSFDFKTVKVSGFYARNETRSGPDMNGFTIGAAVPLGANLVNLSYSTSHVDNAAGATTGDARKISLQGLHRLSKRTLLYAIYAKVRNSNGASITTFFGQGSTGPNDPASALSLGIVHAF